MDLCYGLWWEILRRTKEKRSFSSFIIGAICAAGGIKVREGKLLEINPNSSRTFQLISSIYQMLLCWIRSELCSLFFKKKVQELFLLLKKNMYIASFFKQLMRIKKGLLLEQMLLNSLGNLVCHNKFWAKYVICMYNLI